MREERSGPRVLFIDNYDSFSASLVDLLLRTGARVDVFQNDELSLRDAIAHPATAIVLGPGPKRPSDAGVTPALLRARALDVPILGICLGHQAIGELYGAELDYVRVPRHGSAVGVLHEGAGPFAGIPSPMPAAVYNSLTLKAETLPDSLRVWARAENGEVMAIASEGGRVVGLQFHPESVLSPQGPQLISNWVAALAPNPLKGSTLAEPLAL